MFYYGFTKKFEGKNRKIFSALRAEVPCKVYTVQSTQYNTQYTIQYYTEHSPVKYAVQCTIHNTVVDKVAFFRRSIIFRGGPILGFAELCAKSRRTVVCWVTISLSLRTVVDFVGASL